MSIMSDVKVFSFAHLKFLGKLLERLIISQIIRLDIDIEYRT